MEDLNEDCVKFSRLYLLYFLRNMPSKSVMVGPSQFIVLNDSASPKMVICINFNFFFDFLKILELFECRRGDPLMTTNKNFASFAHS